MFVCRKGLPMRVLKSFAGYYIGTFDEDGPNCRCSGYYKTEAEAEAALRALSFDRVCDENIFCHGGMGCRIVEVEG